MTEPTASLAKIETQIAPRTESLEAKVAALVVTTHPEAEAAAELLAVAQQGQAEIKAETRGTDAKPGPIPLMHRAWKAALAFEAKLLKPWENAETKIKKRLEDYDREEKRKYEEERQRLEAEERARQEAQAAEVAAQLEREGRKDEAEAVLEEAIETPVSIPAPPPPPKISGVSIRESWDFRIKDPARIARGFLVPDEKAIRALVKRLGPQAIGMLGGPAAIEVFRDTTVAGRR